MKLTALGVLQLFRSGYDTDEIAKQFGVSEAEIYNALAERMRWPARIRKSASLDALEPGAAREN